MGAEFLGPLLEVLGAGLGIFLFVLLAYRSFYKPNRTYSLPTLVASGLAATCFTFAVGKPGIALFFFFFACSSLVFGLHAHAIKWLAK